jgi:hypothetical protein
MNSLRIPIAASLLLSSFAAFTQDENLIRLPEQTTVLCVTENATGFNWRDKKWVQANFKGDVKYLAIKVPLEKYRDAESRRTEQSFLCKDPEVHHWSKETNEKPFDGYVLACYQIKRMGSSGGFLDYGMCQEAWSKGKLTKIFCDKHVSPMYFAPDGAFIKYPWHSDIDPTQEKKDSLALAVGSCSTIK